MRDACEKRRDFFVDVSKEFCEKIGKVELTLAQGNFRLPLSDSVTDSVVPHVDGFSAPSENRPADGTCVVEGDKGACMRVAKAGEYAAEVDCLLANQKQRQHIRPQK